MRGKGKPFREGKRLKVSNSTYVHSPRLEVSAEPDYEAAAVPEAKHWLGNSSLEAYRSLKLVLGIAWSSGPSCLQAWKAGQLSPFLFAVKR